MIDVDRMERQLESALTRRERAPRPAATIDVEATEPPTPAPAPAPAPRVSAPALPPALAAVSARVLARVREAVAPPTAVEEPADPFTAPSRPRSRVVELVEDGELDEADGLMADSPSRRERVSWATMRALFDGDEDEARTGNAALHALGQENRDREALDRYWLQRFWLVLAWGTSDERDAMAEHCRDRAYRADDLQWTAALAVLLAQMGKTTEAGEAFEDAFARLGRAEESIQLDVATNLVEAAALLQDAFLAGRLHYSLVWTPGRLVSVGEGWVCKGAIERFRALGEAAVGMFDEADEDFARAAARHRALGARPLLAHTLHQWGTTLVGRDDDRADGCFRKADILARDLGLAAFPVRSRRP